MDLVRCRCGHSIPDHTYNCRQPGCTCRRDRFGALESGLDLVAEARYARLAGGAEIGRGDVAVVEQLGAGAG
jgi:hypothetical protein